MGRSKLFLGLLAGIAAGTLAGILFAPDKGTATRKKIIHQGEDYVDELKEKITSLLANGHKQTGKVRENVSAGN